MPNVNRPAGILIIGTQAKMPKSSWWTNSTSREDFERKRKAEQERMSLSRAGSDLKHGVIE